MHAVNGDGTGATREALDLVCDLLAAGAVGDRLPAQLAPRLARLCRAPICSMGEVVGDAALGAQPYRVRADYGWGHEQLRTLLASLDDPDGRNPTAHFMQHSPPRPGECRTLTRRDVIDDQAWYNSRYYTQYRSRAGLDDQLVSMWTRPHDAHSNGPATASDRGWLCVISLHRHIGDAPFDAPTARVIDLLHSRLSAAMWTDPDPELARLNHNGVHRPGAPAADVDPAVRSLVRSLSKAQLRVLPYLLEGHRETRIADILCRSRYTIHDHICSIYRLFGVHNRVELIVRFGPDLARVGALAPQPPIDRPVAAASPDGAVTGPDHRSA